MELEQTHTAPDIAICDDDPGVCLSLGKRIRKLIPAADIRIYASAEELLAGSEIPDVLFLDVQLPGIDGMTAARELRRTSRVSSIVFISGTPDYVFDAFDVDAVHYLLKPFEDCKLREVLNRALRTQTGDPVLLISKRGVHTRIRHRDIIYAEVLNRTIIVHTVSGDVSYSGKLTDLEHELGDGFFRIHRAYLVNLRYVESYDSKTVDLAGTELPLAKKSRPQFAAAYLQYIRRLGSMSCIPT